MEGCKRRGQEDKSQQGGKKGRLYRKKDLKKTSKRKPDQVRMSRKKVRKKSSGRTNHNPRRKKEALTNTRIQKR